MRALAAKHLVWPLGFACACACAWLWVRTPRSTVAGGGPRVPRWAVAWRAALPDRPNAPCAFEGGWLVSDASGGVTAFSAEGRILWQTAFSNQVFEASVAVADRVALAASRDGGVFALDSATGKVLWTRELDARFQHVPLSGRIGDEPVLWLVSQADGGLFCLRLRDGRTVWQGEPTNRCDGTPALWQGRVAYGNCDGAVYLYDAATGRLCGTVEVGSDDQMAGGLLVATDGLLWGGTRQGNLAAVNGASLSREALVKISEGEAFLTPVEAARGLIVTGTSEGFVVFCGRIQGQVRELRRMPVDAPVEDLLSAGDTLVVLAGGSLFAWSATGDGADRVRLALGDEVKGLALGPGETVACVADQAVVCVRKEVR